MRNDFFCYVPPWEDEPEADPASSPKSDKVAAPSDRQSLASLPRLRWLMGFVIGRQKQSPLLG